jgi:Flp pilus assembly protein TadG
VGRRHRRQFSDERGAALVEAALILPLLLLLVFGIVAFGRGYNAKVSATHAAREGVRVLALTRDATAAEAAARGAATSLDQSKLTVATAACDPGDPTSVTVSYEYTYSLPLLGTRTVTMNETGVMRCGG